MRSSSSFTRCRAIFITPVSFFWMPVSSAFCASFSASTSLPARLSHDARCMRERGISSILSAARSFSMHSSRRPSWSAFSACWMSCTAAATPPVGGASVSSSSFAAPPPPLAPAAFASSNWALIVGVRPELGRWALGSVASALLNWAFASSAYPSCDATMPSAT